MSTTTTANEDEGTGGKRVGITLITGFLGCGKSTLIRRLLTETHNQRLVVVENEFGDTAEIEQAIVTQGVGKNALEEFIELPNGCICCAAQDDLVDALTRLIQQRSGRFDHILVEASGLADPRPVAASFWVDEFLEASLRLDSVVAVVDSVGIDSLFRARAASATTDGTDAINTPDRAIALKQIAVADIVLLNKVDLLEADTRQAEIDRLSDLLTSFGCVAKILPTTHCDVPLTHLLNVRAYETDAAVSTLEAALNHPPEKFRQGEHAHADGNLASTVTVTISGKAFSANLLTRMFGHLLWDVHEQQAEKNAMEIWRMKALVVVEDEEYKWIYQSVHTLFDDMLSSVRSEDDAAQTSRFLFIGHHLNRDLLQTRLLQATITPDAAPH